MNETTRILVNADTETLKFLKEFNPVKVVTASNLESERLKWMRLAKEDNFTCPVFDYDVDYLDSVVKMLPKINELRLRAEGFCDGITDVNKLLLQKLLLKRLDETILMLNFADTIRSKSDDLQRDILKDFCDEISHVDLMNVINKEFNSFRETLKGENRSFEPNELGDLYFYSNEVAGYLTKVLDNLELRDNWAIVRDFASNEGVFVLPMQNLIVVPGNLRLSGTELVAVACREIGCHVLASENCKNVIRELDQDGWFSVFYDYMAKSYHEEVYRASGVLSDVEILGQDAIPDNMIIYASYMAKRGFEFDEIAEYIFSRTGSLDMAFDCAYSVLRGKVTHGSYRPRKIYRTMYSCPFDLFAIRGYFKATVADQKYTSKNFDFGALDLESQELLHLEDLTPTYNLSSTLIAMGLKNDILADSGNQLPSEEDDE